MKFWRKEEKWYTVSTHAMYKTFLAADINTVGATEEKKKMIGYLTANTAHLLHSGGCLLCPLVELLDCDEHDSESSYT